MNYHRDIKRSGEIEFAKSIVYNIVLSIFLTLVLAVFCVYLFGLRLDIVLSDSMANTFYKDDIVVVMQFDEYYVDEIVEFNRGTTKPVTHRIIEKTLVDGEIRYRTQGDANSSPEEYTIGNNDINGKVIAIISEGNKIYEYFKENYFLLIDLLLGVWVLATTINGELEMRRHNIAKVN